MGHETFIMPIHPWALGNRCSSLVMAQPRGWAFSAPQGCGDAVTAPHSHASLNIPSFLSNFWVRTSSVGVSRLLSTYIVSPVHRDFQQRYPSCSHLAKERRGDFGGMTCFKPPSQGQIRAVFETCPKIIEDIVLGGVLLTSVPSISILHVDFPSTPFQVGL